MKKTNTKILNNKMKGVLALLLFTILLAVPALSQGTNEVNLNLSVSANLVTSAPVQLTALRNLIITGVQGRGSKYNESVRTGEIYISPLTDNRAGILLAKGAPNSHAILHYKTAEILKDNTGAGSISVRYELSSSPTLAQKNSEQNDNGEIILNFDRNGNFYLWIGGYVNLKNAISGKYSGQFTFEILYV
jgi:hypothetical protein